MAEETSLQAPPLEVLALVLTRPHQLELKFISDGFDLPELHPGEMRVRMIYSSVQHLDGEVLRGTMPDLQLPVTMGIEGVGQVTESRCERFPKGSRIGFVMKRFYKETSGCWCTSIVLSQERACITNVPPEVPPQEVAAGLTSSITALACLRHFPSGSRVIVTGACGAVGLALMQLAALQGLKPIGLVRDDGRAAFLMKELSSCGEISAINTEAEDWLMLLAGLVAITEDGLEGGADGLIDGICGQHLPDLAKMVKIRGLVVRYGSAGGACNEDLFEEILAERGQRAIHDGAETFLQFRDAEQQLQAVLNRMILRQYRPRPWHQVNWREAGDALIPQPPWPPKVTQVDPGRVGRILLRFDAPEPLQPDCPGSTPIEL